MNLDSIKAPVFDISCFINCRGPVICGHVHIAGCFQKHIYYCGSPYRWQFGEEQSKGFLTVLHNLDSQQYCVEMNEITSFRYDTINLDNMATSDPKKVIQYLIDLKQSGIDFIKVRFTQDCQNISILKNYYKNDPNIVIDAAYVTFNETIKKNQSNNEKYKEFDYILDPNLSEFEIMTRYINHFKGENYITTDELIKILSDI
jgi:DNA repair exonuclease SbcCD nuclease subunit